MLAEATLLGRDICFSTGGDIGTAEMWSKRTRSDRALFEFYRTSKRDGQADHFAVPEWTAKRFNKPLVANSARKQNSFQRAPSFYCKDNIRTLSWHCQSSQQLSRVSYRPVVDRHHDIARTQLRCVKEIPISPRKYAEPIDVRAVIPWLYP